MIFHFPKRRRAYTFDSYIVLINCIKKALVEFTVDALKKAKIYVITIKKGNENTLPLSRAENVMVGIDSITDESSSSVAVAASMEVSGKSSSEEIVLGS